MTARHSRLLLAIPFLWLAFFFLLPLAILLRISLGEAVFAQPPYLPLLTDDVAGNLQVNLGVGNYLRVAEEALYPAAFFSSLAMAGSATALTLLLGLPIAYAIARAAPGRRRLLLALVVLPFWSSFLLRVYAWSGLLKTQGLISETARWLGFMGPGEAVLGSDAGLLIGLVYGYLPFMVLPLYAVLTRLDGSLLEAASDLGAPPARRFLFVTLPLILPGLAAGTLLVFVPMLGEFVIPALLGSADSLMIGRIIWDEFFSNRDWPMAAALAILLLLMLLPPLVWLQRLIFEPGRRTP